MPKLADTLRRPDGETELSGEPMRARLSPDGVPFGWEATRLGEVVDSFYNGGTPNTKVPAYWAGTIPWITGADFNDQKVAAPRRHVSDQGIRASATQVVPKGGLLIVTRTGVGKIALAPCDIAISQDITGITPMPDRMTAEFLYHLLASNPSRLTKRLQGTSINGLLRSDLEGLRLLRPPIVEQDAIVRILDAIESAIEKTESVIAAAERLRTALLQELLTRGVPGHRGDLLRTEIGQIPECWSLRSIEQIASKEARSIQSGPFGSELKHSEFRDSGRLVIGIDNVLNGQYSEGAQHRISEQKFNELRVFQARPLDVLITVMATVGRSCVVPVDLEPAIITKHVYRITVDRSVCQPEFLMWSFLHSPLVLRQLYGGSQGQTRLGLNGSIIKGVQVPLPDLPEQGKICTLMESVVGRLVAEETTACELKIVRASMADALLSGRVRVPLTEQAAV